MPITINRIAIPRPPAQKKRSRVPMTAAVAQKFREHNEQLKQEAVLSGYINQLTAILEARDAVNNFVVSSDHAEHMPAIEKKFKNAGWCVKVDNMVISIWLD